MGKAVVYICKNRLLKLQSDSKYKTCLGYVPISSSAQRPLGTAYVPILLSEVEQEQRPSGNGDRVAIVVGAGLCDGEGDRAYIMHYVFALKKSVFADVDNCLAHFAENFDAHFAEFRCPLCRKKIGKMFRQTVPYSSEEDQLSNSNLNWTTQTGD